jgi:putative endonuclease
MFYVYILKSRKTKKLYIGITNNLRRRLEEHNKLLNSTTKSMAPFDLVYYEAYASARDAKEREKNLKRFSGAYTHLKRRIRNSLILSK